MNIGQIEQNVQELARNVSRETFVYDLLAAYGLPKASITRLQQGSYNLSKVEGEILWKKKLYFRALVDEDLHGFIDTRRREVAITKQAPRFIVVTDFETILAYDCKTKDTLDIALEDLPRHFDFFLPWAGMEKAQAKPESQADVKAAMKMAKLYDLIRQDNPDRYGDTASLHELNVFLSRILFCFFAEDTEIFEPKLFTNSIVSHTQPDASDLAAYLDRLFDVLNVPERGTPSLHHLGTLLDPLNDDPRTTFPAYLKKFPYVNGGLFAQALRCPQFSARTRKMLIECGRDLNWSEINPDIFGSMMQAVVHPDERGGMGMHYTSVTNIMKVIEPLLLTELYREFEKFQDDEKRLQRLIERLWTIRIFDPACGSGNFLIIAYKELRKLEIEIFKRLQEISTQKSLPISGLTLAQFFGIELDDFAHEIAILSLWLAEHQMNVAFKNTFGQTRPSLPLREGGKIVAGNALELEWDTVCPKAPEAEIYILGNPPYIGARNQSKEQKADLCHVFEGHEEYKDCDYISAWILKGADYIEETEASFAFVSTNSVSQGEQVAYIWPRVFARGLEIGFAHQSFRWSNNAKSNAGVTCVIVGVRTISNRSKFLHSGTTVREVENISPYLTGGRTVFVRRTSTSISDLPQMVIGNMARDGGHLILSAEEAKHLADHFPESRPLIRKLIGTDELITGKERFCLWIEDDQLAAAQAIAPVRERISEVHKFRMASKAKTTNGYARIPHKFAQRCLKEEDSIVVPSTSSERRSYVPIGFFGRGLVITNLANVVYGGDTFIFGLLTSRMHMAWIRAIGGKFETRLRYTPEMCYNTFPIPSISGEQKKSIRANVLNILEERENHPEASMEALYDPDTMPAPLLRAHTDLDLVVDRCYRAKPFGTDEERLEFLLRLYEKMTLPKEEPADA
ncbi:DNA methyltransferase [Bradyrhizobium sp. URHC0002]